VTPKTVFSGASRIVVSLQKIRAKSSYGLELLRYAARNRGLKGLVSVSLKIIRSKVFGQRRLVFVVEPLGSELPSPIEVPNYKIVLIPSVDMINEALKKEFIRHQPYILSNTETVLSKGGQLWAGYLDGQLAHIACTRTGDKVGAYFFPMTPECVLISHCVTFPAYRGYSLYPATLMHIVRTLAGKSFKLFYIDCCDWNGPSERAIRRVGFHLLGSRKCSRQSPLL
jgi:hypothetical protein